MSILSTAALNQYATILRDQADQDYIAARICHEHELDQQFLWLALQAVEKYLKAILLYNSVDSKGLNHRVAKALKRVCSMAHLRFSVPADVESFVEYLEQYGADRYIIETTSLRPDALLLLDKAVWYIRRYCFYMNYRLMQSGKSVDMLPVYLAKITNPRWERKPHRYKVHGGLLEKQISRRSPAGKAVSRKNFHFGIRGKNVIKRVVFRAASFTPIHEAHPEVFFDLEKLVHFPSHIIQRYKSMLPKSSKKP